MHGTGPEMDDYNFGGQAPLKGSCITSAVAYVLDQLERSELSNAQYIDEDAVFDDEIVKKDDQEGPCIPCCMNIL